MSGRRRPGPPRILLLDCDAYFVQVARLEDPEGAGRVELLLVGGSAEHRGVITSAAYACRPFGVRSGMPTARALRLCPDATVVPVPRAACARRSREIRGVLERFSPIVEPASIDEFYLDLSGTEALYAGASLADVARRIQATVLAETAIQVSVGGGTSRLVAKIAAGRAKPAGVHVVEPGGEGEFLAGFALRDLPGVGPVLQQRLARHGLETVRDALAVDRAALAATLGETTGAWLHDRIRGIDPTPVAPRDVARSISREETFARDIDGDDTLEAELLALVTRAAADLRREGLRARTVSVKLRDADFTTRQASRTVASPIESDRVIYGIARRLLERLRRQRRTPARLLGIHLSQLGTGEGPTQLSLLADDDAGELETEKDRRLSRAVDAVRGRFGDGSIGPGRSLSGG